MVSSAIEVKLFTQVGIPPDMLFSDRFKTWRFFK